MSSVDLTLGLLGLALTVMIFSYVLGDNLFFRIGLYVLVGVSAGYTAAVLITRVLIPLLVQPLGKPGTPAFFWTLVPVALCVLLALMLIPRALQAGKFPLAFLSGVLAALALVGISRGTLAPQLLAVVDRFDPRLLTRNASVDWRQLVEAVAMLVGVVTVLFYFHHHGRDKQSAVEPMITSLSSIGQIFIGIFLGALFVGLYSTALIALISRLEWIGDFISHLF